MKWLDNLIEKFKKKPSQAEQKVQSLRDAVFDLSEVIVKDYSVPAVTQEVKKETDFEIAKKKFNQDTDILVISHVAASQLPKEEQDWLESLGNKVFYFGADSLVNVAIVRAGYGLNWQ